MKIGSFTAGGGAAVLLMLSMAPGKAADVPDGRLRLAMMDMMAMPMPGTSAQPPMAMPMPGAPVQPPMAMESEGRMGGMPAAAPMGTAAAPMAAPGNAAAPAPMQMCQNMMAMMQSMMRGGAMPSGAMPAGAMPMGGTATAPAPANPGDPVAATGSSAARLEGRIAFLRSELRIVPAQAASWDAFSTALRSGLGHLDAARMALAGGGSDPLARLESYEAHLAARLEAMRTTRAAYGVLVSQLDDAQKRAATVTMLPFIGSF